MIAVIYARYSSDNQREESIAGQLRECQAYAEKYGITILTTYIDRALSAKTDNRPEFQRMVKDSEKGLFDMVLVWKLDRFARNRFDSAHYKAILRKNGVKVVSATEAIAEDSTGILLESLLEGYAEYYSAELSEKVIRGLTENALQCKYNGGALPLGYTIDQEQHFQLDTLTAPFVIKAFELYAQGATIMQVVHFLNAHHVKSARGKPMGIDSVKRLLKNRRYLGEYRYRDVVTIGGIPQIVSQELFERVQEQLKKNKKAPARAKAKEERYLLTTKLFCGYCGAFMCGESGTSQNKVVHHYYKCVTAKNKKACHKKTVKKDWIESLVINHILTILYNDTMIDAITDKILAYEKRENITLPLLKKELGQVHTGIENLLRAMEKGIFTSSTKSRLEQLEENKQSLEIRIAQEEMEKPPITREQILYWLHKFRTYDVTDPDFRQQLVNCFVNSIYLYDDKIILNLNYKDGSKTISLEEMNRSGLCADSAP